MSGATLNQPIPPAPACIAKKICIFAKSMFTRLWCGSRTWKTLSANNCPCLQALRPCHFTTGVLIDSGRIIHCSGLNLGRSFHEVMASVETRR